MNKHQVETQKKNPLLKKNKRKLTYILFFDLSILKLKLKNFKDFGNFTWTTYIQEQIMGKFSFSIYTHVHMLNLDMYAVCYKEIQTIRLCPKMYKNRYEIRKP